MTNVDTPPPDMTSSEGRVAHLRNWVEQLSADINRLTMERDALWQAIAVLDPTAEIRMTTLVAVPPLPPEGANTVSFPVKVALAASVSPKKVATKKPAAKKAPPAPKVKTGAGSKYDYLKIAKVAHAAALAGTSLREAVKGLYPDISDDMAGWVLTEARRKGFTIAKGTSGGGARQRVAKTVKQLQPAHARNWSEIARHMIELRDAGQPVAEGLAAIYKVPASTTRNWMARCRELGLVPTVEANLKVVEDDTVKPSGVIVFDAAQVAEAYREATRTGHRQVQFVADTFDIDRGTAQEWVRMARAEGALPPAGTPQLSDEERRDLLNEYKPEPVG